MTDLKPSWYSYVTVTPDQPHSVREREGGGGRSFDEPAPRRLGHDQVEAVEPRDVAEAPVGGEAERRPELPLVPLDAVGRLLPAVAEPPTLF